MRNLLPSLVVVFLLINGCSSPSEKNQKAEAKVEKAKQALVDNRDEQIDKAKGFVYAADFALSLDPKPSRFSEVGKLMTERSLLTLGQPELETALQYQKIIDGLLSTNLALQKRAQADLDKKDKEVVSLQTTIESLENKLGKAEDKRKEISAEHASMASKWARMMFWIKSAIFVVIGGFILRLVTAVVGPPWNSIGYIIDYAFGAVGKAIFKLLPKAKEAAGVVAREAYDVSERTLTSVVSAVQSARQDANTRAVLDPLLQNATEKEITRPKIIEVKTKLGHI